MSKMFLFRWIVFDLMNFFSTNFIAMLFLFWLLMLNKIINKFGLNLNFND